MNILFFEVKLFDFPPDIVLLLRGVFTYLTLKYNPTGKICSDILFFEDKLSNFPPDIVLLLSGIFTYFIVKYSTTDKIWLGHFVL